MAAAPEQVESIIVELDYCEVEMWKAIRQSYEYMTRNGPARGGGRTAVVADGGSSMKQIIGKRR